MKSVLLLEDDKSIQRGFISLFEDLEIQLRLIICDTADEYNKIVSDYANRQEIKAYIFDLAITEEEIKSKEFESLRFIQENYSYNRAPIFMHSVFIDDIPEYEGEGTIFKIKKSDSSINQISRKIKLFLDTGFLEIFSLNGIIEKKLLNELHNSFVSQFKFNEIEEILNSIISCVPAKIQQRTLEVFERLAVRSLYRQTVDDNTFIHEEINEIQINAIEHYFRRFTKYEFWTGDVFRRKRDNFLAIILTPRCNIANGNIHELIVCGIKPFSSEDLKVFMDKNGAEKLRRSLIDDVTRTGERYRFLPRTPQFEGGNIDFNCCFTIQPKILLHDYERVITISDEMTNEIVRKFTSYLSRFGISNTDIFELIYYMKEKETNPPIPASTPQHPQSSE